MERIELEDKVVYRPSKGCKLLVLGKKQTFSEVICDKDTKIEVIEVEKNG